MSRALTARMKALRVKAQAMPVPMFSLSVLAASQVAWVTELRKSSGVQTQSMPAASADPACSARSAGVSPIAAIEMRSSADKSATRALVQAEGTGLLVRFLEQRVVLDLRRIGLELVDVSLHGADQLIDLSLLARGGSEGLDPIQLLLDVRHDRVRGELLQLSPVDVAELLPGRLNLVIALLADRVRLRLELRLRDGGGRGRAVVVTAAATGGHAEGQHGCHCQRCIELHVSPFRLVRISAGLGPPKPPIGCGKVPATSACCRGTATDRGRRASGAASTRPRCARAPRARAVPPFRRRSAPPYECRGLRPRRRPAGPDGTSETSRRSTGPLP